MLTMKMLGRALVLFIVLGLPSVATAQPAATVTAGTWQVDATAFARGTSDGLQFRDDGMIVSGGETGTYASVPVKADFEFVALGVTWHEPLPATFDVTLDVRTSRDGLVWSEWYDLPVDTEHGPEFSRRIGSDLLLGRGRWFQLRLQLDGPADIGVLPGMTVTYLDTREGPALPQVRARAADDAPAVITRAQWGADEAYRFDDDGDEIWPAAYQTPEKVIVHHTATTNDIPDPPATVRAIYYYHTVTLGWGDIGYNFLVDPEGRVYEGRFGGERERRLVIAGHAHRYNPGSIGIAVLGDFQPGSNNTAVPLPPAAEATLGDLIAHRGNRYGIHPLEDGYFIDGIYDNVIAHRDVGARNGATLCPGDYAYDRLDEIRADAWSTLQTLTPEVFFTEPADGAVLTAPVTIAPLTGPTVTRIDLLVDGTVIATDGTSPFEVKLDPADFTSGEHTVTLAGYTQDGRRGEQSQTFSVPAPPNSPSVLFLPVVHAGGSAPAPLCDSVVINGDMETDAGWTLTTDDEYNRTNPASYASVPHSGTRSVFVGLPEGATSDTERWSSARQMVELPADDTVTLSLYYKPESEAGADDGDLQYVLLLDETGTTLELFLRDRRDDADWQHLEADLSAYAGETVELYLGVKNDGAGGSTRMYVDDVEICRQ